MGVEGKIRVAVGRAVGVGDCAGAGGAVGVSDGAVAGVSEGATAGCLEEVGRFVQPARVISGMERMMRDFILFPTGVTFLLFPVVIVLSLIRSNGGLAMNC